MRAILLATLLWPSFAARAADPPPAGQGRIESLTPAAQSGDREAQYERGMASEEPEEAVAWLRKAAEQGHAEAQFRLARDYAAGFGVAQDKAEAAKWDRRAAEQGQVRAQLDLGLAYALGEGVARDDREAVAWYRRAAAQNDPLAQVGLGQMVGAGRGVAKDEQEAAQWYDRAAHQNVVTAMVLLAQAYARGRGVPLDRARAYYWLSVAAREKYDADDAAQVRDELAPKLSPAELAQAEYLLATLAPPAGQARWAPLVGGPAEMPQPAELCASLTRVMAASASLETLRGKAKDAESWRWAATEALPGTHGCEILKSGLHYGALYHYRCVVSRQDDAAVARADLENLRRLVSQCLGESWRVWESQHPDPQAARPTLYFSRERAEPSLQLVSELDYFKTRTAVRLEMTPPGVSATLKRPRDGAVTDLETPIDIKAKDEAALDFFAAVAQEMGVSAVTDPEVAGRITLERQGAPLREVFDAACAQAGCHWFLHRGEQGPELYMERKRS